MKFKFILIFLTGISFCYGQQNSNDETLIAKARFDSILTRLDLDTLGGQIKAIYEKKHEVRALQLQSLMEECCLFYEKKFPETKFTVQLIVVGEHNWNALETGIPYGLPTSLNSFNKILIAGDKKYVGELYGKKDTLPDDILSEFDYIVLHELGHNFFEVVHQMNTGKHWSNEFLASYFAIYYLEETKSKTGLPQMGGSGFEPSYKTLEDFERLYFYVGPPNYAWYQEKFIELGKKMYLKFKLKLIQKFIQNYAVNGEKIGPLDLLNQMSRNITQQWLMEMK